MTAMPRWLLPAAGAAMLLTVSGCSNFKQIIGLDPAPPDEFTVESRAPLVVPPDFDLRPPAPGAPRPQELSPAAKAQQEINAAGPGQPGEQATGAVHYAEGVGPNPSEQVGTSPLATRLLTAGDVNGGATIERRATTPLAGIY